MAANGAGPASPTSQRSLHPAKQGGVVHQNARSDSIAERSRWLIGKARYHRYAHRITSDVKGRPLSAPS